MQEQTGSSLMYIRTGAGESSYLGSKFPPYARSFEMNRLLSWLIVLGLALGISACDKREGIPNAAKKEKDQFVAAVENDVQETKAKISDLKSKITNATGKAKNVMEQQITALEEELRIAEQKLTDLKSATVEKWKDLQRGMSTAIDHLKQSVQKAHKESA
jgi:hypothetical protein